MYALGPFSRKRSHLFRKSQFMQLGKEHILCSFSLCEDEERGWHKGRGSSVDGWHGDKGLTARFCSFCTTL